MMSGYYAAQAAGAAIRGTPSQANAAEAYAERLKNSDIVRIPFCYRHIEEFYGSYGNWLEKSKAITV
jgi:flavin-dependent dehydrogenase